MFKVTEDRHEKEFPLGFAAWFLCAFGVVSQWALYSPVDGKEIKLESY